MSVFTRNVQPKRISQPCGRRIVSCPTGDRFNSFEVVTSELQKPEPPVLDSPVENVVPWIGRKQASEYHQEL